MKFNTKTLNTAYLNRCAVEIQHWTTEPLSIFDEGDGGNRWNVYLYLPLKHPNTVKLLESEDEYGYVSDDLLPFFHGGITYSEKIGNCLKVGSDYQHYGDSRYSRISRDGWEQFLPDTEPLFEYIKENYS